MSKERYSKLLQLRDELSIEDYSDLPEDGGSFPIAGSELDSLPEYVFNPLLNELNIILESKIFSDGQFNVNRRKYFQINDFEEFIYLLCRIIHDFIIPINEDEHIKDVLLNLLGAIEDADSYIRLIFKKRESSQLEALKKKLGTWLHNAPQSLPVFPSIDEELVNHIYDLFNKHIPNIPKTNICIGVSKVLELCGITYKPNAISMRVYRK
jgi:hypothetical protein